MENFFLISSGSMNYFPDNTRAVFKNMLPKDYNVENNTMFLNLEKAVFSNTYKKYISENDDFSDIICRNQKSYDTFKVQSHETVKELYYQIVTFFNTCAEKREIFANEFFDMTYEKNKITLTLLRGDVLISDRLKELLMFDNYFFLRKKDVKSGEFYNILRLLAEEPVTYTSSEEIRLNEDELSYICIKCDEIDSYEGGSQIIAKIPLKNQKLNDFSNQLPQYFRIDMSVIKELNISFLQPNNVRVFFDDGSPNILKFNLKKNLLKMDFFYLNVTSKVTGSYPDNTCSDFTYDLMKDYDLKGEWEVCVLNAYIPRPQGFLLLNNSIYDVNENEKYFGVCIFENENVRQGKLFDLPFNQFRRRQLYLFLEETLSDYANVFVDNNELCILKQKTEVKTESVLIFTSRTMFQILNSYYTLPLLTEEIATDNQLTMFDTFKKTLREHKIPDNQLVAIFLSTEYMDYLKQQSHSFLIPPNIFYNDSRDETMIMDSSWEKISKSPNFISQHELHLIKYLETINVAEHREFTPSFFFIYADFVVETAIGEKFVNFLKLVPYKNGIKGVPGGLFTFNTEEFFTINRTYLSTLSFRIRTHSGETYRFFPYNSEIQLMLKLRKKIK